LWHQQNVSSPGPLLPITNAEAHLSRKDLEDLILALVDMQRRTVPEPRPVFQDGDVIASVLIRYPDQHPGVEEPEVAAVAGGGTRGHRIRSHLRCWARYVFISNMVTRSLPNTARSLSSALISRLLAGF